MLNLEIINYYLSSGFPVSGDTTYLVKSKSIQKLKKPNKSFDNESLFLVLGTSSLLVVNPQFHPENVVI